MNLKTLLIVELHVVAVLAIAGVLAWRLWYVPRHLQTAKPAETVVVGVPPTSPETDPAAVPAPSAKPVAQPAAQPAAKPAAQPTTSPATSAAALSDGKGNLLKNGSFAEGLKCWTFWRAARDVKDAVVVVPIEYYNNTSAARINDPQGELMGVQQLVSVESGKVYRLSGAVRSLATTDSSVLFGGRIAFFQPQREHELKWVTENTNWWEQSLVITNDVTGVATVYAHMGYGNAHSTGEFTCIRFEQCR